MAKTLEEKLEELLRQKQKMETKTENEVFAHKTHLGLNEVSSRRKHIFKIFQAS